MSTVKLGEFLKGLRIKQNKTQKEISTELGYGTSQFISNWERGISYPPTKAVKKLVKLYKLTSNDRCVIADAIRNMLNKQADQKWQEYVSLK